MNNNANVNANVNANGTYCAPVATLKLRKNSRIAKAFAGRFFVAYTCFQSFTKWLEKRVLDTELDENGAIVAVFRGNLTREQYDEFGQKYVPCIPGLSVTIEETDGSGNVVTAIRAMYLVSKPE